MLMRLVPFGGSLLFGGGVERRRCDGFPYVLGETMRLVGPFFGFGRPTMKYMYLAEWRRLVKLRRGRVALFETKNVHANWITRMKLHAE